MHIGLGFSKVFGETSLVYESDVKAGASGTQCLQAKGVSGHLTFGEPQIQPSGAQPAVLRSLALWEGTWPGWAVGSSVGDTRSAKPSVPEPGIPLAWGTSAKHKPVYLLRRGY